MFSELSGSMMYVPDSHIVQDDEDVEAHLRTSSAEQPTASENIQTSHVLITTTKVSNLCYFSSF